MHTVASKTGTMSTIMQPGGRPWGRRGSRTGPPLCLTTVRFSQLGPAMSPSPCQRGEIFSIPHLCKTEHEVTKAAWRVPHPEDGFEGHEGSVGLVGVAAEQRHFEGLLLPPQPQQDHGRRDQAPGHRQWRQHQPCEAGVLAKWARGGSCLGHWGELIKGLPGEFAILLDGLVSAEWKLEWEWGEGVKLGHGVRVRFGVRAREGGYSNFVTGGSRIGARGYRREGGGMSTEWTVQRGTTT